MTKIKRIMTGIIQENCYIIYQDNLALIVDPGAEANKIEAELTKLAVKPVAVLLTHCHYDHIGALEEIRAIYDIPVYVSPLEQEWLSNPELNLSAHITGQAIVAQPAEHEFTLGDHNIEGFQFKVVPTPGHSIGSVSFIFDEFVVVGDALFKGSIGRTDLFTGDFDTLINSIKTQLFVLPDELPAYSGHGDATTIGHEKKTNPYFN
ncbi:MBL fold metallo-hydrolase [Listeria swaminathanii]|uniref:MBL fold metallo-hydrolase n=1 Tax=Listeria swaminathanii TaxID=2713501 RepID=A0A7X1A1V5_9LIST|nr:MBL fold metallo-hydrolase [Listeria swaminathanii]MCD2248994.1 MBL fold metallo-hydrolase [Listeria marthii]MBC2330189.1 MBL fold metallo-hydrolase [Listeria swaminathanii]MDT0018137.1 MBL fold metallo-hydrolase [Listeria swaminathanii]MDT0022532.1 MBL fold metallo-hydrolase [Listeria swaminathanii]MDT0033496.1 MBL fold metallo-hydrolase [Listeria swaminathanii]